MTTVKDFQRIIYVPVDGEVEVMTYADFLREYYNDETTTAYGVANRRQVAPVILNDGQVFDYDLNDRG